jgi:copper homeostasis protein
MTVEVCVGDLEGARVAEAAGADRVELCADLAQGGTTPSIGTVAVALRALHRVSVRVMIRPRGGDFRFGEDEVRVMLADIEALRALPNPNGVRFGVVVGATAGSGLDMPLLRRLIAVAAPLPVTVHKAFDEVDDQVGAVEELVALGVDAVLTSGAAPTALEGAGRIAELNRRAADRVQVMAGGGVRAHNVRHVLARTGVRAVHLRAPVIRDGRETTDGDQVRRVVAEVRAVHHGRSLWSHF